MNKFTFYHVLNEKKENNIEKIFQEIKNQIIIYHRQFNLTLKSYKKEWNDELKKNDDSYEKQRKKSEKIYNKAIEEYGDDVYAHTYANNASGLSVIAHQHQSTKEDIDREYEEFLDLYSKSILIALYSLNESELNRIAVVSSEILNKKIKPSHFDSRNYLISSITYLNLVIEIETETLEKYITSFTQYQYLRNGIVHNSSKFKEDKTLKTIQSKFKDAISLNKATGNLRIRKASFIKDYFQIIKEFYENLLWQVDLSQDSIIVKNGLNHWIKALNNKSEIEQFKYEKFTEKEKLLSFKVKSNNEELRDFDLKIIFKKSENRTFELTDQTGDEMINEFLIYEKKLEGDYLVDIIKPFDFIYTNYYIKILAY
ncbi:hypothetical protein [uncultured Mesonia sp.]|uniref:hypothetical protein n=1 Tax=uncultured Mesonia sp. TaxID=399731 RepID=UPI00374EE315